MFPRTCFVIAALAAVVTFCGQSAHAQQWMPAGGYVAATQSPMASGAPQAVLPVRYHAPAFSAGAVATSNGFCSRCATSACHCPAGACARGLCPQGCPCASGQCQCADGSCPCGNGQCGCICPPGACQRGECVPGCPCPGCNGSGATTGRSPAPYTAARPVTHTTLRRPVIADAPLRTLTATL